jgi:hypothetical protein
VLRNLFGGGEDPQWLHASTYPHLGRCLVSNGVALFSEKGSSLRVIITVIKSHSVAVIAGLAFATANADMIGPLALLQDTANSGIKDTVEINTGNTTSKVYDISESDLEHKPQRFFKIEKK